MQGRWGWHTRRPLYAGAAATVAVLLALVLLVVPGGGASHDRLVSEEPTPSAKAWLQEIVGGEPTATITAAPATSSSPSTEPLPVPSGTSPAKEDQVPAARLLTTDWLEAVVGRGRARWSWGGQDPVEGNPANAHRWWWLGETEVQETVEDAGTVDRAKGRFADLADWAAELGTVARPHVGDAALTAGRRTVLMTDTRALLRVGQLVVQLSWRESGRVEPGPTQLRLLEASAARLRGDQLPPDHRAPVPDPVPGAVGYLGQPDVQDEFWSGDSTTDQLASPFRCTPSPHGQQPGQDVLALAEPAVVRHWSDVSTLSTWFARGEAADRDTAAADFESCRRRLGAVAIEGMGDAAFCASWDNDQEQLCMVRSGDTYFAFRAARGYPISSAEAFRTRALPLLRTALARDPGA